MPRQRSSNRTLWITAIALLCAAAAGGAWFRWRSNSKSGDNSALSATKSQPVQLIASGDTAGWITPCGCTSNQSGGLPRRGTYVSEARQQGEVILVDVGGAAGGTSPYDLARFEAILRGETEMGVTVHNIGASEVALGADSLRRLTKELNTSFLSANVTPTEGDPIALPFKVISAGGQKFAIVGLLSPRFKGPGLRVAEPRDALLAAIRSAGEYDRLIVLAYLPEAELRQLASALPEAELVVGGPTGQSVPPTLIGERLLASATNKGKFLACLTAPAAGIQAPWTGEIVELSSKFTDDPTQKANVTRFHELLDKRDFLPHETSFASRFATEFPAEYQIAGEKACAECHSEAHSHWTKSGHSHAWATLQPTGSHVDAECQRCHTTGYGLPGGFLSAKRTPELGSVSCESCHGPSKAHARNPTKRTPFPAKEQCVRCHDHENSPKFDYATYWPRIAHGREKVDTKSTSELRKNGFKSPREARS